MFDRLEDLVRRYQELMDELNAPEVVANQENFRRLMKEQNDLAPIVEAFQEYRSHQNNIQESLAMLEEESDEELRELAKQELAESKEELVRLEERLKVLLLPKDPNDEKSVIVEIRAGAGGDEAALFAAEIYRMYVHYAESRRNERSDLYGKRAGGLFQTEIRKRRPSGTACTGNGVGRANPYLDDYRSRHAGSGRSGRGN